MTHPVPVCAGTPPSRHPGRGRKHGETLVVGLDVAGKVVLLALLALVLIDPEWGNLEGKAPVARAITYPLLAFALPLTWWFIGRGRPFPWLADLMVTAACFSDILGNRLDLYDRLTWFDDWMHFMNAGLLSAALVLLTLPATADLLSVLERAVAFGLTVALAWELFEYLSFMTGSAEYPMAYEDTMGDLLNGWVGAVMAALLVHRSRHAPHGWAWA